MTKAILVLPLGFAVFIGVVKHSLAAAFVAFYLFLLFEVIAAWLTKRRWPRGGRADATMTAVDAMDGIEFESYVAARLGRAGWQVTFTPPVGDYGVDLIAEKDGQCVAIQCKRYGKPVGVAAVQQVVSGALHHGCTRSMVFSNQEFTTAAKQLAGTHRCRLIGRAVLQGWVQPPRRPP